MIVAATFAGILYYYYQRNNSSTATATFNATGHEQNAPKSIKIKKVGFDTGKLKKVIKKVSTPAGKEAQKISTVAEASQTGNKYTVILKAYFHNAPDESTRRAAFINKWNNAVLTPLDDKNGFIYIVYTNEAGQTSKGWLRKQDLKLLGK